MQPPAPYSKTDTAEIEAINTLHSLLDPRRVKADMRQRDKLPNIDGYLELVDEQGHPCGMVALQIKRISSASTSCPCPVRLVSYTAVTSLPVILVGVDPTHNRAFWAHVSPLMPGYKADQQTFTVRFNVGLDHIDKTAECPCYRRWLQLARDYQARVHVPAAADMPSPARSYLTTSHVAALQRFIDAVNHLIDGDLKIVKALLFPGIWKFGVGCRLVGDDRVFYQILRAPEGSSAPLIVELPESFTPLGENVEMAVTMSRDIFFRHPEQHGRKFVFEMLQQLVAAKALPVRTAGLAADLVFGFIRRYHRWLEIDPDRDEYSLEEIREAFGPRLSRTTRSAAQRLPAGTAGVREVNLDLHHPATTAPQKVTLQRGDSPVFVLSSTGFPLRASFESVASLSSLGVSSIKRRFRNPDREHQPPPNNFIWSCYSRDREIQNVEAILDCGVSEYDAFIRGCGFGLENSAYLSPGIAIVFEYVPSHDCPAGMGPALNEYHLRDPEGALPKTTVLRDVDRAGPLSSLVIDNVPYEVEREISRAADFFFKGTPLFHLIYTWLADDLKREYAADVHH